MDRVYKSKLYKADYKCPHCNWINKRDIKWPTPDSFAKNAKKTLLVSCWCVRCGSIHKFELSIKEENENVELKTYFFICDDEKVDTQLKLL